MESLAINNNSKCTGCGACANICKLNAILMDYDQDGFLKPFVNESVCEKCGKCVEICPSLEQSDFFNDTEFNQECYALWASEDILLESSSGGFFSVASSYVLDNQGVVFGAAYDNEFGVEIISIDKKTDIDKLRRSKYVQSDTKYSFRQVKKELLNEKKVIFFGLPCQIHGLKNYLKDSNTSNLITVDLLCAGVPSAQHFKMYLRENHNVNEIEDVIFHDKKTRGWSPYGFRIIYKNGKQTILTYDYKKDPYLEFFLERLFRNDVCENCSYCKTERIGDITIGDFWGIESFSDKFNKNGTSICLINTNKGKNFFEKIKSDFKGVNMVPIEWSFSSGNRVSNNCLPSHPNRKYFAELIKKGTFNESVKRAINGHHEIGLVTCINHNIGNNITNYALYRYLKNQGFETLVITPPLDSFVLKNNPYGLFDLFIDNPFESYDVEKSYHNKFEMYCLNDKCDTFLVGSDQLFRKTFIDASDYYSCLDWVRSNRYKLSYATSLGISYFEGERTQTEIVGKLLKRFNNISVRESSGVDIMKKEFNVDAVHTIDPIFLLDKSIYKELSLKGTNRLPKGKYVACYILDESYLKKEIIEKVAEVKSDNEYVAILDTESNYDGISDGLNALNKPKNEEWIAMIEHCEILVTDSFHATCMAIILNKPFVTISDPNYTRGFARISDILKYLELEERIVTSYKDVENNGLLIKAIDYKKVENKLKTFIEYSKKWLENTLSKSKEEVATNEELDKAFEIAISCRKSLDIKIDGIVNDIYSRLDMNHWETKRIGSEMFFSKSNSIPISTIIDTEVCDNMQIVLWGVGNNFHRNISKIKKFKDVKYVCDNAPEKWGNSYEGLVCISPEQLRQMKDIFVLIAIDDGGITLDIAKELINMGITSFDHIHNWLRSVQI